MVLMGFGAKKKCTTMSNDKTLGANDSKQDSKTIKLHIDDKSLINKKDENDGLITPSAASETGDQLFTPDTGAQDGLYPPTDKTIDDGLRNPEDDLSGLDQEQLERMKKLGTYTYGGK